MRRVRSRSEVLLLLCVLCGGAPLAACAEDVGATEEPILVGFSVGGIDWPRPELRNVSDPGELLQRVEEVGFLEASLTHGLGGNAIRLFFDEPSLLGTQFHRVFWLDGPFYAMPLKKRLATLDEISQTLEESLRRLGDEKSESDQPVDWGRLDAYLDGIARFNGSVPYEERIRLLLTLVARPPRAILESPSDGTLRHFGREYDFGSLWNDYYHVEIALIRGIVRRYLKRYPATRPGRSALLAGVEIVNEPDYHWIPDEMRIEKSLGPEVFPLGKYITEKHSQQIPVNERPNKSFEPTQWGYREQDVAWDDSDPSGTPAIDFDWGRKFDRYVKYFAQLQEHLSYAARDESISAGTKIKTISGSVTNCNLDYLIRMYRANPNSFAHIDAIGLHPYHWPRHDIWDASFVSQEPVVGWKEASPRGVALRYFKRFDFLREITRITRLSDTDSYGMSGRKLWVTEFGVPTKKLGSANRGLEHLKLFIYERGEEVPEEVEAIVWEDKWDRFFDQVDSRFLREHNVEAFFFYTLREGLQAETSDDEHSNFALLEASGEPRMDPETLGRLESFMRSLSGRSDGAAVSGPGR